MRMLTCVIPTYRLNWLLLDCLSSKISCAELVITQRNDPGLKNGQREDCSGESLVQVVVPEKFREVVLRLAHGDVAWHLGVKKTNNRVLQHFYWPLLKKDILEFI